MSTKEEMFAYLNGVCDGMREANKEERQGVDEYISSVSQKVYSKYGVIGILDYILSEMSSIKPQDVGEYLVINECKNIVKKCITKVEG